MASCPYTRHECVPGGVGGGVVVGGIAPLIINLSEFDVQVTVHRDKFL